MTKTRSSQCLCLWKITVFASSTQRERRVDMFIGRWWQVLVHQYGCPTNILIINTCRCLLSGLFVTSDNVGRGVNIPAEAQLFTLLSNELFLNPNSNNYFCCPLKVARISKQKHQPKKFKRMILELSTLELIGIILSINACNHRC